MGDHYCFQLSAIPMCLPDERFETKILLLQSQRVDRVLRLSSRERELGEICTISHALGICLLFLLAAVNPQTLRFPHLVHIPCRFLNETLDALPNAFFRDEMDVPDALAVCKSPSETNTFLLPLPPVSSLGSRWCARCDRMLYTYRVASWYNRSVP